MTWFSPPTSNVNPRACHGSIEPFTNITRVTCKVKKQKNSKTLDPKTLELSSIKLWFETPPPLQFHNIYEIFKNTVKS